MRESREEDLNRISELEQIEAQLEERMAEMVKEMGTWRAEMNNRDQNLNKTFQSSGGAAMNVGNLTTDWLLKSKKKPPANKPPAAGASFGR